MVFSRHNLKAFKALKRNVLATFMLCAGLLALLCAPHPTHAQGSDLDIPNEFIFEVLLPPDWRITEALFAYEENGKYYLPMSELGAAFDFLVETETDNKLATGFAGSEENSFTIDGGRNELIINGRRESLNEDAILVDDFLATDDLYVQLEILNQIWPVNMSIDLSTLTIVVEAEEELPFMLRKDRETKRALIDTRKAFNAARREKLPRRENTYSYFGKPVIDYQATYRYDDKEDNLTGSNVFTGVQQLGKLLAEFSANFRLNEEKELDRPDNVRLRLSRKSAGEEYLVKGVRRVEAGDVSLRQRDLIANTETGRGLVVSNDNRDRFNEFDEITIEGQGPPGWEIELYNNEELVDFNTVPENGQFFFEDVVLNFGNNNIKILLFGPQGQVREQTQNYVAGGNMLPPGEFIYNTGFLDVDRPLILLDNEARTTPRGVVKNLSSQYGVNRWLTVFGNYAEIPEEDEDHSYVTAGGVVSTPIGLVEAEAYNEIGSGYAVALDYITSFYGVRTNLGIAKFNDFESQEAGFGDNKKTFETTAQLNKLVKIFSTPIGLRLNSRHTERETGDPVTNIDTAQTFSSGGLRLSHNTSSRFNDFSHESTTGGFATTWRNNPWQLRGTLNYEAYPLTELTNATAELRYTTDDYFFASVNAGHNFTNHVYNFGGQVGYEFEKVRTSFESNYEREEGWDFILRATTSLHPYTEDGSYDLSSRQRRNDSPIRAKVFIDKDADGVFNEGDEPIEDARLNVGFGSSQNQTDENGLVIVNAPTDKLTNFSVDNASLVDPYLMPLEDGFSSIPARGGVIEASFPVVETGAIEGTVYRSDSDAAVAGLTLSLINQNGEQVGDTVFSAFDGFYAFEFVRPGTYSIAVDPSHNVTMLENTTTITPDDIFVYGNDLYIEVGPSQLTTQAPKAATESFGPFMPAVPPADVEPAAGTEGEIFGPFAAAPIAEETPMDTDTPQNLEPLGPEQQAIEKAQELNDTIEPQTASIEPTPAPVPSPELAILPVRFKAHNNAARLILETDSLASYEVLPSSNTNTLEILLKGDAFSIGETQTLNIGAKEYALSSEAGENGTTLLIQGANVNLKRDMSMPSTNEDTQKIIFDIN